MPERNVRELGKSASGLFHAILDEKELTGNKRDEGMTTLLQGATIGAQVAGDIELANHFELMASLWLEAQRPKQVRAKKNKAA